MSLTRRSALALTAAALAAPAARAQTASAATAKLAGAPHDTEITAKPIERFGRLTQATTFGRLTFRGGLTLSSDDKNFGGLSGIAIEPDGKRFLAISDEGHWVSGIITYKGPAPSGITSARMGEISATSGRALSRKRDADCESITLAEGNLTNGQALLAFERNHRIGRFPIVNGALQAPAGYLRMPPEAKRFSTNKGFESVAVISAGALKGSVMAFAERYLTRGNHTGWVWQQGEPRPIYLTDVDGFDVTDLAALPDGSMLVLERRFRWTEGVQMRLRRIKADALKPGSIIDPEVLLAADMTNEIDNMEGLAVHTSRQGEVVVTIVSDDNFSQLLQRTILLQFTLS